MTFVTIGPNQVRSEEGYVVWMKTPSQLHYTEGNHELIVPGEMMTGVTELLVSTSTIKQWRRPEGAEPINLDTRQRITGKIAAALDFMGIRYEFD